MKLVYASTWFESPLAFSKVTGQGRDDSMAVIIQQLAGRDYGDFWYPAISGVAQSHNFYPVMDMRADEGIATSPWALARRWWRAGNPCGSPRPTRKNWSSSRPSTICSTTVSGSFMPWI